MFIIEGADHLGKTTFARSFLQFIRQRCRTYYISSKARYAHMTKPDEDFNFFTDYKDMISTYAIMDRFHLGGRVWQGRITTQEMKVIEGQLLSVGSVVVVLYESQEDKYEKRCQEAGREEMFSVRDRILGNRAYKAMVEMKTVHIDYAHDVSKSGYLDDQSLFAELAATWEQRIRLANLWRQA